MMTCRLVKRFKNLGKTDVFFCKVAEGKRPLGSGNLFIHPHIFDFQNHCCLQTTSVVYIFVPFFKRSSTSVLSLQVSAVGALHMQCTCERQACIGDCCSPNSPFP